MQLLNIAFNIRNYLDPIYRLYASVNINNQYGVSKNCMLALWGQG